MNSKTLSKEKNLKTLIKILDKSCLDEVIGGCPGLQQNSTNVQSPEEEGERPTIGPTSSLDLENQPVQEVFSRGGRLYEIS